MRINKREKTIFVLISIMMLMGVGYAYLTSNLSIEGSSLVKGSRWSVYWDNIQVIDGSVAADAGPTIDVNKTNVSYTITLKEPGDYFEFTVDAVNDGTIDAMLEKCKLTINDVDYLDIDTDILDIYISYDDGILVQPFQLLKSGDREKYRIKIKYKKNINAEDLPSEDQVFNISINAKYVQSNDRAFMVRKYYYRTSEYFIKSSSTHIEEVGEYFENYEDLNSNVFLRHTTSGRTTQVLKSDVGFIYNDKVYYLLSGGASSIPLDDGSFKDADDSIYYEENKGKLKEAFGEANCSEKTADTASTRTRASSDPPGYYCNIFDDYGNTIYYAYARMNGSVYASYHYTIGCSSESKIFSFCSDISGK